MNAISSDSFKAAMRRLAASVSIVTTRHAGQPAGLVATAVCSVSADPPMLLVCINRDAHCHDVLAAAGTFCVNVLDSSQAAFADRFAKAPAEDRFQGLICDTLTTGAPALTDALIVFDCETANAVTSGSHTVFFGRIVDLRFRAAAPLLYFDGRYAEVVPQSGNAV
jgi:flavin reductase (DIM6/NTAB) family NADH-FMN oxidoreductase RutF